MSDLTQTFLNFDTDLTADEIAILTREAGAQWPSRLIEDYLTKFETLLRIVNSLDLNNDQTSFLLAQDGLSDATSLQNFRRVDNAREEGVQLVRGRRVEQDIHIESTSRRESNIDHYGSQLKREKEQDLLSNVSRRDKELSTEFSLPGRIKRLSIDDLTVESIISGNISANVNATPANTVAQLELKDKAGNTYYLPLYGAPW